MRRVIVFSVIAALVLVSCGGGGGGGGGVNGVTGTQMGGSIQGTPLSLTTVVTTLAGTALSIGSTDDTGAAARFYSPYGITTDGVALYVADSVNNMIRVIK